MSQLLIERLAELQLADGSFAGLCGPMSRNGTGFMPRTVQPTVFPTILILDCLRDVAGAEPIRTRAANFLLGQVSCDGAWNYWRRDSDKLQTEPYPDDLDDTALAFAALQRLQPEWADGKVNGQLARLLVSTESATGGPYNTWLADVEATPQWRDIDVAVNANIAYALAGQGVRLTALEAYLSRAIEAADYKSKYYCGDAVLLHFLARTYQGPQQAKLHQDVHQRIIAHDAPKSYLQTALLLLAGLAADVDDSLLSPLVGRLTTIRTAVHLSAEPLYVDPIYHGVQHYGGSQALTIAFVLQALCAYGSTDPKTVKMRPVQSGSLLTALQKDVRTLCPPLRRDYLAAARMIVRAPHGKLVTAAASSVMKANGWRLPVSDIRALDLACLNGWVAYTAYDDVLDGSQQLTRIGLGNVAARLSQSYFLEVFGRYTGGDRLVHGAFVAMDCANDWEQRETRRQVEDGVLKAGKLPDYGNYSMLAQRSVGHSLPALGVLTLHFGALDHPALSIMKNFFSCFLIARQLNDDAHDWESDVQAGQLSAVVTMLLRNTKPRTPIRVDDLASLRVIFWRQTIDQIADLIAAQLELGRHDLERLAAYMNVDLFERWLVEIERSVEQAIASRDESLAFMAGFGANV